VSSSTCQWLTSQYKNSACLANIKQYVQNKRIFKAQYRRANKESSLLRRSAAMREALLAIAPVTSGSLRRRPGGCLASEPGYGKQMIQAEMEIGRTGN